MTKTKKIKLDASKNPNHLSTETDKVGEIAIHYGFTVVNAPQITADDLSKSKPFRDFDYYSDTEEKVALTRWYEEMGFVSGPQPMLINYKKPLRGGSHNKKSTELAYGFEIMGSGSSTSEATLIKVALDILTELGYKNLFLDINSIGDRESIQKFERELSGYIRKHLHEMPAKMRIDVKKNPYSAVLNRSESVTEQGLPETIGTLSDLSRAHFKEVLEYVEVFNVAYKIRPDLLSNKTHASHTVFEIRDGLGKKDEKVLAYGYRYNYLAKKIGGKRDIQTMGMTLIVKKNPTLAKKVIIKNIKKPKFYLVQLGATAKLKALNVLEMLRRHKIAVYHSLSKDKIGGQLSGADYMKTTHLLIIGQKEAVENSVVVRNINTREQETVSLKDLPDFLKGLK
jgi:histidyl-tRNA synthetase